MYFVLPLFSNTPMKVQRNQLTADSYSFDLVQEKKQIQTRANTYHNI